MKTKIEKFLTMPRILAFIVLAILLFLASSRPLIAQQVTQGYGSDQLLERGMIVRLKEDDADKVASLKQSEMQAMHGVVVAPNDSPITLSSDDQKVFVATSGKYEVLVSTQNGEIKSGDYISISSTDGIGMKAGKQDGFVIGKALGNFNSNSSLAGKSQVNGKTVEYGRVLAEIDVAANPLYRATASAIPNWLQDSAEAVGGKPVSPVRTYIAIFILVATMVITGSLLYGGIRSSITAVGRNPLSRAMVGSSLFKVLLIGLIIFLSGIFAVYLLLKL